jgi:hypothetical protein
MSGFSTSPNIMPTLGYSTAASIPSSSSTWSRTLGSRPPSRRSPPADTWFCRPPGYGYLDRQSRPLDLVGDVTAADGHEAHGVGLHGRRDGADELGQVLLDVPVGIDDQRHDGPLEGSIDAAIIGHGSLHI